MSSKIRRLDEVVVNKIAAGEVIQRPANAVKEMIENSLDADSSTIQVIVKAGGLKLLQVQDNGAGIEKEDMKMVCERFTTSKLEKFEDLSTINTYGFRGEALASISHVAHVTITTRTAASKCAFKAAYSDGKLVPLRPGASAEPKLCAGNQGTLITVEDLFYNVATRRKALKSPSDELAKITDVMMKYAVHNAGVGFTLKKHGASVTEIKTSPDGSIEDNIGLLYGTAVQKELVPVSVENAKIGLRMKGYVTNPNFSMKKCQFLLFINNRLVDSPSLRKALEVVYAALLPKNCHPFIYLSMTITPENIDVNVHPTKFQVQFLHEDMIIETVQKTVEESLLSNSSSRTYYTQSLLPSRTGAHISSSTNEAGSSQSMKDSTKDYDYKLIRTDSKEKKLDAFLFPEPPSVGGSASSPGQSTDSIQVYQKPRKPVHLTSVLSLQDDIHKSRHKELGNLFCNHSFVGVVDQTRVLVQHETRLLLVNLSQVSKELFFQLIIFGFSNFGRMTLSTPASIYEMVLLAIESPSSGWSPEDGPKEKLAQYAVEFLSTKSKMLLEYFSFGVEDGCVYCLPVLLEHYVPNLDRLPQFLLCLAVEVDWLDERKCFLTFARECALFYSIQYDPFLDELNCTPSKHWTTEHVVLPALRSRFFPPCSMAQDGSVLQIADLHELYKVFERC